MFYFKSNFTYNFMIYRAAECRRGLAMRILSARLSNAWILKKNGRKISPDFYTI